MNNIYVIHALLAAALFGASTPFAKLLVGEMSPWLLAGLLYLGSGLGLAAARLIRDRGWTPSGLARGEWPWLLGAIFFGGVLGPLALMFGLTRTSGATASLLLNLEAVLTAVIAWVVFREKGSAHETEKIVRYALSCQPSTMIDMPSSATPAPVQSSADSFTPSTTRSQTSAVAT